MSQSLLLVDNDDALLRRLARDLEENGYGVWRADAGAAARERVAAGGIDLVILDVVLGCENGWETLRLIREFSAVPVLLMTAARVDEDFHRDAKVLGAQGVLEKPFDATTLVGAVRAALERA